MRAPRFSSFLLIFPVALSWGCSEGDDDDRGRAVITSVVVDPAEFLGTVPCANVDGAARSYSAVVREVESGNEIGSSSPVSCGAPVAFENVELGFAYEASVRVFDVPPEEASGATPAWETTCGEGGVGAAIAAPSRRVTIHGCKPLTGGGTGEPTVLVDASSLVGELGCTSDEGLVDELDVVPLDDGLPAVTLSCGQPAVSYGADIEPGTLYAFHIEGRDAKDEVRWAADCTAIAREGIAVVATCSPLTSQGTLVVPVAELVSDAGLTCGEDVTRAEVSLTAGPTTTETQYVGCDDSVSLSPVGAGSYLGQVRLVDGDTERALFSCTATVAPSATATFVCEPET